MVLGDLQVTSATLGELWGNAETRVSELHHLATTADPRDVAFYSNVCDLINRLTDWLRDQGPRAEEAIRIMEQGRGAARSKGSN